jgi:hypothetical protein
MVRYHSISNRSEQEGSLSDTSGQTTINIRKRKRLMSSSYLQYVRLRGGGPPQALAGRQPRVQLVQSAIDAT